MSYRWSIEVEQIRAGQPRPYADTEYVTRLTYRSNSIFRSRQTRESVLDDAKGLGIAGYSYDKEQGEKGEWHQTYLDYCKEVDRGPVVNKEGVLPKYWRPEYVTWEIRTVTPYND